MKGLAAALSIDVDTLADLFPGYQGEDPVYDQGVPRFLECLERWGAPATFFVVGGDLDRYPLARRRVAELEGLGHEVANHSQNHLQAFWTLDRREQARDIAEAQKRLADTTGRLPRGFRAPGWNHDDRTLDILEDYGFLYDSSVMPSLLNPLLKLAYRATMRDWRSARASCLGPLSRCLAPLGPYRPGNRMWRRGERRLWEIPISVDPLSRLPFLGTFLLGPGRRLWPAMLRRTARAGLPLVLEFHGVEFVSPDPALLRRLPGGYRPRALGQDYGFKLALFDKLVETARALGYSFTTLEGLARPLA